MLDTILNIQPKDAGSGGGETREAIVYRLANDMLDKLPPDYVPFEVTERLQKMGILQPMNIFLRQEIDRMQKVISIVRSTLMDLKLAIDGTIIMSENLRDALDNIFDARVPNTWKKVSGRAVFFIVTVSGRGWRLVATVKENSFFMILQIVCNVQIPPPPTTIQAAAC